MPRQNKHDALHKKMDEYMEKNAELLYNINDKVNETQTAIKLLTQKTHIQNGRIEKTENVVSERTRQIDKLYLTVSGLSETTKTNKGNIKDLSVKVGNNTWYVGLGVGGIGILVLTKQLGFW